MAQKVAEMVGFADEDSKLFQKRLWRYFSTHCWQ